MQIEIKERKLAKGRRGLYLEYYEKGFRKRENLHLYIEEETCKQVADHNKKVWAKAQEIRSERILNPPNWNKCAEQSESEELKTLTWIDYIKRYIQWGVEDGNCKKMIDHKKTVLKHIARFLRNRKKTTVLLKDVDRKLVVELFHYMKHGYTNKKQIKDGKGKLAEGTLCLFQETVRAIFNKAIRDGLLKRNYVNELKAEEKFHTPDTHREYLTVDELTKFLSVEPKTPAQWNVQHAFGFACMTGIRFGDMRELKWGNIIKRGDVSVVSIVQNKTGQPVSIPLNELALSLLPERPNDADDEQLIFQLAKKPDGISIILRRLAAMAEIEKDFTFHCSRHTAATLAITAGAELYSVSKILGHTSTKATQVYAKVDLSTRIETVNLVDGVFG